jgi:2-keto-4-pentenoate hydratase
VADRRAAHEAAAERLLDAARRKRPCRPVRDLLPDCGLDDGYAVQTIVHARGSEGRRRVGRKIGLTSPAVQQQMGVDTPDFGVLFADMAYGDSEPIPFGDLLQPRVEAEVAFVLGADLTGDATEPELIRAIDVVVPAIEVVDSRIADWDISIFDTVADNASAGVFVTGGSPRSLRDVDDLGASEMTLTVDGEVVSSGTGAACLGHPLHAVAWLAKAVAERGEPLRAGELVLSGSLGALVPVRPGLTYDAHISGLGSVRATFTPDGGSVDGGSTP